MVPGSAPIPFILPAPSLIILPVNARACTDDNRLIALDSSAIDAREFFPKEIFH
jgi:hypothetical protein